MKRQDLLESIVVIILAAIGILCVLWLTTPIAHAQDVIRKGDVFEQISKKKTVAPPTLTKYAFKALDGKVYPIYISAKGAVFIVRISKKGNKRPDYKLPEELKTLIRKEYGFSK